MKTTEQLVNDIADLRASLEKKSPGCTAKCLPADEMFDLDQLSAEKNALLAIQSAITSAAAVQDRGAAVAVSAATLTPMQRLAAGGGAKAMGIKSEMLRIEAMLPSARGKTHEALAAKHSKLNAEHKRLLAAK